MNASGEDALTEIRAVLKRYGELLEQAREAGAPAADLEELAAAWAAPGYSAEGVEIWLAARCCTPAAASLLTDLHVDPETIGAPARTGGLSDTLGFLVAAGRLTDPAEILVAAGVSTLLIDAPTALALDAGEIRARELAEQVSAALEELGDLLGSQVTPITANELAYELVRAIGRAGDCLTRLGERSYAPLADYLTYNPPVNETGAADGARQLAERLTGYGEELDRQAALGHELFFGRETFNPSGFGIRMAMKDGRRVDDFLDEHDRRQGERP